LNTLPPANEPKKRLNKLVTEGIFVVDAMKPEDPHLSDQDLLLDVDGEHSPHDEKLVRAHLKACWECRVRRDELENAISHFVHLHHREFEAKLPPPDGPRALLKAQLAQLVAAEPNHSSLWFAVRQSLRWALALTACCLLAFSLFLSHLVRQRASRPRMAIVSTPDSRLTPGAALLVDQRQLCAEPNIKNKEVPVALRRRVLEEYGIVGAEPRAYEIDYLITPALGGADDIHNLWPQSYSTTAWNADVKDALEDRLRQMVCDGNLDLTQAQREIAGNWIGAYKKYFRTDKPLPEAR
jgi:hypothetical protein